MQRSPPHPRSRKTPRGGRRTAKTILQMSLSSLLVSGFAVLSGEKGLPSGKGHDAGICWLLSVGFVWFDELVLMLIKVWDS